MHDLLAPFLTAEGWISLVTLVALEIVLGVDNIIFIAILCGRIPDRSEQQRARVIGLVLALVMRIVLLVGISWIARLVTPLFMVGPLDVSGRDLILFGGGLFLLVKTFIEIRHRFATHPEARSSGALVLGLGKAILQITLIDIVFSFDSIITAVGLSNHILIMVVAVTISMFVMIGFAPYVSDFINKYPTIKMLALVFLVGIGLILVLEALDFPVGKSYLYVAMVFSLIVEWLNIRLRKLGKE